MYFNGDHLITKYGSSRFFGKSYRKSWVAWLSQFINCDRVEVFFGALRHKDESLTLHEV